MLFSCAPRPLASDGSEPCTISALVSLLLVFGRASANSDGAATQTVTPSEAGSQASIHPRCPSCSPRLFGAAGPAPRGAQGLVRRFVLILPGVFGVTVGYLGSFSLPARIFIILFSLCLLGASLGCFLSIPKFQVCGVPY